jgi:hypothetical protein
MFTVRRLFQICLSRPERSRADRWYGTYATRI